MGGYGGRYLVNTFSANSWNLVNKRPILIGAMEILTIVKELYQTIQALPSICNELMKIIETILVQYVDFCNQKLTNILKGTVTNDRLENAETLSIYKIDPLWSNLHLENILTLNPSQSAPVNLDSKEVLFSFSLTTPSLFPIPYSTKTPSPGPSPPIPPSSFSFSFLFSFAIPNSTPLQCTWNR